MSLQKVLSAMYVASTLLVLSVVMPVWALAQENAGLVQGVWFSKEPVLSGADTDISAVVYNSTDVAMEGTVTFRADDTVLGTAFVSIAPQSIDRARITHAFTEGDWEVTTTFEPLTQTDLAYGALPSRALFVDADTDGDGIGNREDTDDDGDGIADTEDSDPLVANEPEPVATAVVNTIVDALPEAAQEVIAAGTSTPVVAQAATAVQQTTSTLEEVRQQAETAVNTFEEVQRARIDALQRAGVGEQTDAPVAVEGFLPPDEENPEGSVDVENENIAQLASAGAAFDLAAAQVGAAGASAIGAILHSPVMFYIHIVLLIYSILHLFWSRLKKRFHVR